ncbi:MAG: radical SAM protein [Nanoarchaeota archaeon]|nr:radical SAM protein [Nanoarchaeota archaeon]
MHFHIILTEKCNSQCKYCYEKSMKEFDYEKYFGPEIIP